MPFTAEPCRLLVGRLVEYWGCSGWVKRLSGATSGQNRDAIVVWGRVRAVLADWENRRNVNVGLRSRNKSQNWGIVTMRHTRFAVLTI